MYVQTAVVAKAAVTARTVNDFIDYNIYIVMFYKREVVLK